MPAAPAPLVENLPFAFRGEPVEPARLLTAAVAKRLRAARNVTGKSNADVLRETIGVTPEGDERRVTAIDFPAEMSAAEARLYVAPFTALVKTGIPLHRTGRNEALRNALARLDRFLACPADETEPAFAWIDGDVLPDASLAVWARDDDCSAAVLGSRAFALWCERCGGLLGALRSFPFPSPPATPLSSLTRAQEEQRFALARAARSEDREAIDAALAEAYGWPANLADEDWRARLAAVHVDRVQSNR